MKVNRKKLIDLINRGELEDFKIYDFRICDIGEICDVSKPVVSFEYGRLSYDLYPDRENFQLSTFIFQEEIEKAKKGFIALNTILSKYGLWEEK